MNDQHDLWHKLTDFIHQPQVKQAVDGVMASTIVMDFLGWLTLSNFSLLCTAIWMFGRVVEMFTGKPVHIILKDLFTRGKRNG